jgi:hypothetical protein
MNQKRLGPLKKLLRMTNMFFASLKIKIFFPQTGIFQELKYRYFYKLICMSVIQLTDKKRRIRRDKKRRIRRY